VLGSGPCLQALQGRRGFPPSVSIGRGTCARGRRAVRASPSSFATINSTRRATYPQSGCVSTLQYCTNAPIVCRAELLANMMKSGDATTTMRCRRYSEQPRRQKCALNVETDHEMLYRFSWERRGHVGEGAKLQI
jgi:hypothetical protein